MKFVTVVDPHCNNSSPRSRKDKLWESQKAKWEEIRGLCEHGVDGLIVTGDWFHPKEGHRVHYAVVNWMIEFFRKFPCPVYGAMGNHDIMALPANWRNQPIGALVKAEAFIPLWQDQTETNPTGTKEIKLVSGVVGNKTAVQLSGTMYSYDYDRQPEKWYAVNRNPDVDLFVHVPHGSLVPENHNPPWEHTTPTKLATVLPSKNRADLYVAGHEHDDLGVYDGPGFKCMNFGSLTRGSIQEYNLTRQVKVGIVEIGKTYSSDSLETSLVVKLSQHVLTSAKPSADVFYVGELKKEKLKNEEIAQFATLLREKFSSQFKVADPMDMLEVVFQGQAVSPQERERTLKYVNEARAELGE